MRVSTDSIQETVRRLPCHRLQQEQKEEAAIKEEAANKEKDFTEE